MTTGPMLSAPAHRALRWRHGAGAARVLPGTPMRPESGVHGDGCSVSTPALPDESFLRRFGHICSALAKLTAEQQLVLSLWHGDAGFVATTGGLYGSRRWRAIAPLTAAAAARGAVWVERVDRPAEGATSELAVEVQHARRAGFAMTGPEASPGPVPEVTAPTWARPVIGPPKGKVDEHREARRDLRAGPPAWRWLQWALDPRTTRSREDTAALDKAEREALALIRAAEAAFAAVYVPLVEDQS